jgi:hypothetical protein
MTEPEVVWRDPAAVNYYNDGPPFDSTFGADLFVDEPTLSTSYLDDRPAPAVVLVGPPASPPSVVPAPERIVEAPLWQPSAPASAAGPTPLWQPEQSAAAAERTPLWASAERGPVAPRPAAVRPAVRRAAVRPAAPRRPAPRPPTPRPVPVDARLRRWDANGPPPTVPWNGNRQPSTSDPRAVDPRFRPPKKRRRGRLGFIPPLIVLGLVVAGNAPSIFRSFTPGSSTSAVRKVVNQYYDAVEQQDGSLGAGYICSAQRATWTQAANAAGGDLHDVASVTVNSVVKAGSAYNVGVVVARTQATVPRTLTVVKESGAWKICGGTN